MQTIGEEKKVGKRIVIASRLKRLSTFALSPSLGTIFFFFFTDQGFIDTYLLLSVSLSPS
jgi:hypothetical protein